MKKVIIFILILFFYFQLIPKVFAKDINILIDDSAPSFQQVNDFFITDNMLWAPGSEEAKTLVILNKTNIPQYILLFALNKNDPSLVSQAMHITIENDLKDVLFSNSLFAFINRGRDKA